MTPAHVAIRKYVASGRIVTIDWEPKLKRFVVGAGEDDYHVTHAALTAMHSDVAALGVMSHYGITTEALEAYDAIQDTGPAPLLSDLISQARTK